MVRAMTTLKPQLVRADTLDLQDHSTPSAKDHSRQPTHPSPYGYGPAAPHQAQTLRHAQEEEHYQQKTSPRVDEDQNGGLYSSNQHFYDDPEDELEDEPLNHLHDSNGVMDHDRDLDDVDGGDSHDDEMDDDMMDKISSSPSIEDGKYSLLPWLPRADYVDYGASPAPYSTPFRGIPLSSSPCTFPSQYFSLSTDQELDMNLASHLGKNIYDDNKFSEDCAPCHQRNPTTFPPFQPLDQFREVSADDDYQNDFEVTDIAKYLLPVDDPFLDSAIDETKDGHYEDENEWEDADESDIWYNSSSEDDSEDFFFTTNSLFIDYGWGGECLQEVEDIDFEFVYALHTFVATVEGQANATKGDTMVLLDDSNSYWWLVRVVKDGSIGYLPAEHIETPTERLARLNKHRNMDLSARMLGDNPEKSKNPLKKAMRRRNAKTVQFAAPTYFEPSDSEYSDEEDGDDSQLEPLENGVRHDEADVSQDQRASNLAIQTHEPQSLATTNGIQRTVNNDELAGQHPSSPVKALAPEPLNVQAQLQEPPRSRKGVVRNTDSFFKDDTAETRKISLTPRLLRGDSDSSQSVDQELRQRPSLETFDKLLSDEKPKEENSKKKEKKGMLSGLFKRKDKGAKGGKEPEKVEKISEETLRTSTHSKDSLESISKSDTGPERKPSKLQKQSPIHVSPKASPTEARAMGRDPQSPTQNVAQNFMPPAPTGPAPAPPITRQVEQAEEQMGMQYQASAPQSQPQSQLQSQTPAQTPNRFPSLQEKRSIFSPITTALKSSHSGTTADTEPVVKGVYSKRAKERFAIEHSDSEDDSTPTITTPHRSISPLDETQPSQLRTDSGMQISPMNASANGHNLPQNMNRSLAVDTNSNPEGQEVSTQQSSPLATEITPIESELTASTSKASPSTATHTPSTSRSTPTWSDASLRSYMENDQDIKDLLIIIHDKSNVTPVGMDHPLMSNLFSNERTKLADMQSQLDSMLMSWLSKKNGSLLSR